MFPAFWHLSAGNAQRVVLPLVRILAEVFEEESVFEVRGSVCSVCMETCALIKVHEWMTTLWAASVWAQINKRHWAEHDKNKQHVLLHVVSVDTSSPGTSTLRALQPSGLGYNSQKTPDSCPSPSCPHGWIRVVCGWKMGKRWWIWSHDMKVIACSVTGLLHSCVVHKDAVWYTHGNGTFHFHDVTWTNLKGTAGHPCAPLRVQLVSKSLHVTKTLDAMAWPGQELDLQPSKLYCLPPYLSCHKL